MGSSRGLDKGRSKPKQKSQRSAVKVSGKRLLSRFGKKLKKGLRGHAVNYITRTQAVRKLQVTLRDFRRLCILKGIYPRVPKTLPSKSARSNQTYYHAKDINYLAHEPVLQKFRDLKAWMNKVRAKATNGHLEEARRLHAARPQYQLDHLIRERYPRFGDAVGDMDDALTMAHTFAALPADKPIEPERVAAASRLCREWQRWVVLTRSLRRVFISIKGYYFQAEVQGIPVTWLVPHKFSMPFVNEVDYRVMLTFLEVHDTLLKFIHFRLYRLLGLAYPPKLAEELDGSGALLGALQVQAANADEEAGATAAGIEDAGRARGRAGDASKKAAAAAAGGRKARKATVGSGGRNLSSFIAQLSKEAAAAADEATDDVEDTAAIVAARRAREERGRAAARQSALPLSSLPAGALAGVHESMRPALVFLTAPAADQGGADGRADAIPKLRDAADADTALVTADDAEADADLKAVFGEDAGASDTTEARELAGFQRLFEGLVFFLNREVPREPFEFAISAFGGVVGWDGPASPVDASSASITHHVIDRPMVRQQLAGRDYVQPQWVFDSINARMLLPTTRYVPGAKLPPHLSPFVDDAKEGYIPAYRRELDSLQAAAEGGAVDHDAVVEAAVAGAGGDSDDEEEDDEELDMDDEAAMEQFTRELQAELAGDDEEEEEEEEDEEEDDDDEDAADFGPEVIDEDDDEEEEEAVDASGRLRKLPAKAAPSRREAKAAAKQSEAEEHEKMLSAMLPNRKRRMYTVAKRGIRREKGHFDRLARKAAAIEEAAAGKDGAKKVTGAKRGKKPAAAAKATRSAKKGRSQ